ncbi:LEM-3-like GIY-YIG domain-containing protein [Algiphilus sp.]|uniref:LEM-3-like GIY-YIG domain-containing protein n=1 Tax=Algiphilus sp. TaxID=1872431 RepID=UPI003BA98278
MNAASDYYVYVYIDPRNYEEFYFGKGRGSRKDSHLTDGSDSEKAKRISDIQKEGLQPIVRVIARGLSEHDALLVEKTLLWRLGRQLTNISSGHYADNFRPHNTLHLELTGFDYQCGFYYYNVGEGPHRSWDDFKEFGFISAGQGVRWRDAIRGFNKGDVVAAYLKGHGFVGIGKITSEAKPINEVFIGGKPLLSHNLRCAGMSDNASSKELCEHVATVNWLKSVDRSEAKMQRKSGIYTTTHVRASLDGQPRTVEFLEEAFEINVREYLD